MSNVIIRLDNPAARFYHLIERVKKVSLQKKRSSDAWAEVLHVRPLVTDVALRLADVAALPGRTREALKALPEEKQSINAEWIQKAEGSFGSIQLNGQLTHFLNVYDDATMRDIRHCALDLSLYAREPVVEKPDLDVIRNRVQEILSDLQSASDLPAALQQLLRSKAKEMLDAVERYNVTGVSELRRATDSLVGGLLNAGLPAQATVLRSSIGAKIKDLILVAAAAVSIPAQGLYLAQEASGFFSPDSEIVRELEHRTPDTEPDDGGNAPPPSSIPT